MQLINKLRLLVTSWAQFWQNFLFIKKKKKKSVQVSNVNNTKSQRKIKDILIKTKKHAAFLREESWQWSIFSLFFPHSAEERAHMAWKRNQVQLAGINSLSLF